MLIQNSKEIAVTHEVWPVRDAVPSTAPGAVEATDLGVGEVLLTWVNPSDADFDHVEIYRSQVDGITGHLLDPTTNVSYVDTVEANTTYYYTVTAFFTDHAPKSSEQASVTTGDFDFVAPATPADFTATDAVAGGSIDLSWTNPTDSDLSHIVVYRSLLGGSVGSALTTTTGTSFQDTKLINGTTYFYTLEAVDTYGNASAPSAQVSATPSAADATVAALVADVTVTSPGDGGVLDLTWTDPVDPDVDYIRIYRSGGLGDLGEVVYETSSSPWQDTGLNSGSTYYYTLRTVDFDSNENPDETQYFETVSDTIPPANVTGLSAVIQGGNTALLTWTRSASSDASAYKIYGNNGSGEIDYTAALATLSDPDLTSWTSGVLNADDQYLFGVRTLDNINEEQNKDVVVGVSFSSTPPSIPVAAAIKVPHTGKKIAGLKETVMAELIQGTAADVLDVTFLVRSVDRSLDPVISYSPWEPIVSASAALPNQDATSPYFIHWDTSGLTNGEYQLKAVAANNSGTDDPAPGFVSVIVDNAQSDNYEDADVDGYQYKTEKIPFGLPNTLMMGEEQGLTKVTVPADALNSDAVISVAALKPDTQTPPANYRAAGAYWDIAFDNGQTALDNGKKADIEVPYTDDVAPFDVIDGTNINIYDLQLCNDHGGWKCLPTTVDPTSKTVKAKSDKFSTYGLLMPPRLSGYGLTMITVPLATPNNVFNALEQSNKYVNYLPIWDPKTGTWIKFPGSVEPGKSYFIWSNGETHDMTGPSVPDANFVINLEPGWNMIGNPFRYQVPINQIQVECGASGLMDLQTAESNSMVVGTFFHYANGSWETWSVQDNDNLPTWKGLYILSDQSCTLTVPPVHAE